MWQELMATLCDTNAWCELKKKLSTCSCSGSQGSRLWFELCSSMIRDARALMVQDELIRLEWRRKWSGWMWRWSLWKHVLSRCWECGRSRDRGKCLNLSCRLQLDEEMQHNARNLSVLYHHIQTDKRKSNSSVISSSPRTRYLTAFKMARFSPLNRVYFSRSMQELQQQQTCVHVLLLYILVKFHIQTSWDRHQVSTLINQWG